MANTKQERALEIFFRGLRGEDLSVKHLFEDYGVTQKSISRSINDLKAFLADHREEKALQSDDRRYQQRTVPR